ncbi:MAG: putative malate transporter YflS [Chlamydiales bacterium]|nr:putative malate transporter YflS [Chlamydiales bacterium]MCH9620253.1 putative malate transporter YflS [Chlamydiales bacterium]MCH9622837.1 putative malate transporter YflS [Chlamydiales bacterium]
MPVEGWRLLAIFLATILGIILKPLPIGAMSILALSVATMTKTLSLEDALAGFHNPIAWLVVFAFFISRGFIKTGLGMRIAYYFVSVLGQKTLGLGYGLLTSDLILAPAIPSVTARTGGVVFPVARSIAQSFGSDPELGTRRRIGSYLMKVAYQGSVITSTMFLTAMAANPFLVGLAKEAGYSISWGKWATAALVPGLISLTLMPLIVYKIYPPEIHHTPDAAHFAKKKLADMGPFSRRECLMLIIFVCLLFLWILGGVLHINATMAALGGLAMILVLGILDWEDVIREKSAWDTFIWFSSLIMLATQLGKLGFTPWFSHQIVRFVGNMGWVAAFSILALIYFYSHYFFASNTAHVGAMFPTFLVVAIALGTPPALAILVFAFSSSLFGGLTQYGSGPAPLYFGSGYIEVKEWWGIGFLLSVVNIVIWFGLGSFWWKFLGLW